MGSGKSTPVPAWCRHIKALRKSLEMSQSDFSGMLNISAMTVSRWENGKAAPSSARYIELGRLAGTGRWYFWSLAGIRKEDFQELSARETDHTSAADTDRVVAALETQARLCEICTTNLRGIIRNFPNSRLQRDYLAVSRASKECVNALRTRIGALKHLQRTKEC
jgi:transcriptional regulator with XRE-family HTH domain